MNQDEKEKVQKLIDEITSWSDGEGFCPKDVSNAMDEVEKLLKESK
jgi:hypothetical protein